MFKALIIVLEVALLIMLLRTSFVQYWLNDVQSNVAGWIEFVAEIPEQHELSTVKDKLQQPRENMSTSQQAYLDSILVDRLSLQKFYRLYCVKGDFNPFIYGANLQAVCSASRHSSLVHNN
jgi:hypothetical protein